MKKILFLFILGFILSSCGPELGPRIYCPLIIIRFENEQYYDYVFGYDDNFVENFGFQCKYDIKDADSVYLDLANGYKIVYGYDYRHCHGKGYHCPKFAIMDMKREDYKSYLESGGKARDLEVLDSFPKFDLYLFTYDNIGPYQKLMAWRDGVHGTHQEPFKDFYPFTFGRIPLDVRQQYIDVLNDMIVNSPEDLDRYCTVHVKDNNWLIDRPTEGRY